MERVSISKRRDPFEVRMRLLHKLIDLGGKSSKWKLLWSSEVAYSGTWAFDDLVEHGLLISTIEPSLYRDRQTAFVEITPKGRRAWEHYQALRADLE